MKQTKNLIHALWDCEKIKDLPAKKAKEIEIDLQIQWPRTSHQLILYDNFCNAQTLFNSVWMLQVSSMLSA